MNQVNSETGGEAHGMKERCSADHARLNYHMREAREAAARLERDTPTFAVGDVVQLKSGGHAMTITSIGCGGEKAGLTWSNACPHGHAEFVQDELSFACLQPYDAKVDLTRCHEHHIPF